MAISSDVILVLENGTWIWPEIYPYAMFAMVIFGMMKSVNLFYPIGLFYILVRKLNNVTHRCNTQIVFTYYRFFMN